MTLYMRARKLFKINTQKKMCSSSSGVQLRVLPSSSCFFDESVQIKLSGLPPGKHVELRAKHQDDKAVVFRAAATYQADARGEVDLSRQPSTGGSYTGVEPMGLFWSMLPESPHKKLRKRDASSPVLVHIEAHGDGQVLTQGTNERRFMADGVKRVPVRDGRLRGTLFIPPGKTRLTGLMRAVMQMSGCKCLFKLRRICITGEGPFPGIIDLYTLGGTMCEPRAALLANKGFVVFALAFYGFQDMPKTVNSLDLEYFEEGLTFLQEHPKVKKTGMGILSLSKGGDLALSMASFLPNVAAIICINGCNANTMFPLHYRDMVIPPLILNMQNIIKTPSGIAEVLNVFPDVTAEETRDTIIPIERASCKFLFIVSGDDKNWNSTFFASQACSRLKAHGKANYEMASYPKAGHFMEVPYMPHCPSGFNGAVEQVIEFGGEPKAHADAQVDAWRRVEEFFKKHLNRVDYVKASL